MPVLFLFISLAFQVKITTRYVYMWRRQNRKLKTKLSISLSLKNFYLNSCNKLKSRVMRTCFNFFKRKTLSHKEVQGKVWLADTSGKYIASNFVYVIVIVMHVHVSWICHHQRIYRIALLQIVKLIFLKKIPWTQSIHFPLWVAVHFDYYGVFKLNIWFIVSFNIIAKCRCS